MGNDPVNFIDPLGLEPSKIFKVENGDRLAARDKAATNAIDYYILKSNEENKEIGGFVYSTEEGFSYTEGVMGTEGHVNVKDYKSPPEDAKKEAIYHTHVGSSYASDVFSFDDYLTSEFVKLDTYFGTIDFLIKVWSPSKREERVVRKKRCRK